MPTKKPAPASPSAAKSAAKAKAPAKVNNVAPDNQKVWKKPGFPIPTVKSAPKAPELAPLTPRQQRFVDEYLIDLNGTQAAIRAGYSIKTANSIAAENLAKPSIAAEIEKRRLDMQKRTEITQDMVLQQWWKIATADPNELISHRRVCCRNCFGKDHHYQWVDEAEFERAARVEAMNAAAEKRKPRELTDEGGYGFDATVRPHPKCPECKGEGHGEVFASDTRDVSDGARLLYAGVKQTKEGMEVKMRDQDGALANIARHLGMFKDTVKLHGDEDNPLRVLLSQIQGTPLRPKAGD